MHRFLFTFLTIFFWVAQSSSIIKYGVKRIAVKSGDFLCHLSSVSTPYTRISHSVRMMKYRLLGINSSFAPGRAVLGSWSLGFLVSSG